MRLAIVDDEEVFRLQLADSIFSLYGRENASCFLYSDGSEFVKSLENGFMPDAVFLDIEMRELDGMSTARVIREYSRDIPVIFLTSHTEKAIEGYEVEAFRFLGKPVDKDKLRQALTDLEKRLMVDKKIVLRRDGEDLVYSAGSLIYVEASNNCVRFVFGGDAVELRMKFSAATTKVDDVCPDFFQCHRSYYVALAHVKKLGASEVLMDNGDTLPVARSSAAGMRQALFDYVRRTGR